MLTERQEAFCREAWSVVQRSDSLNVLKEFIRSFPDSVYASFAKARIQELRNGNIASKDSAAPALPAASILGLTLIPAPHLPGSKAKEGVAVQNVEPSSGAAHYLKRGDIIFDGKRCADHRVAA